MAAVLDLISDCAVTLSSSSSLCKYKCTRNICEKANHAQMQKLGLCISCNKPDYAFGVNFCKRDEKVKAVSVFSGPLGGKISPPSFKLHPPQKKNNKRFCFVVFWMFFTFSLPTNAISPLNCISGKKNPESSGGMRKLIINAYSVHKPCMRFGTPKIYDLGTKAKGCM